MPIFENPYIIIIAFIFGFFVLGAIGLFFAARGIKAAEGHTNNDFISIGKLERDFYKAGKQHAVRCLLYIRVSADQARLLSEKDVLGEIRRTLFYTFAGEADSSISAYDEKNYLVLGSWDMETARSKMELCQNVINKGLTKHNALHSVFVRTGAYFAAGAETRFDEAVSRAKQASVFAENENLAYSQWDATSGKALEKKIKIENSIEQEIDNNRFFLEYQPVIDAKTKKIIGAEVLSRLNSETDGVLTPKSFLSAVDSVGINEKFDYYIFEKNCKWISNDKKQREGYKYTINFSRSTLSEPAFAEKIIGIAQQYDLKLSCLAVEILEDKNLTGDAQKQMIENLSTLKEKGISVLLDDFGSGFTTFGDLQNLDISIVKIDKSITQNATTQTGFIILKNIIRTSQDIGFKTLCEGVETQEQEEAAIRAGCDLLQGFYYYKPMPVAKLEELLSGGI